MNARHLALTVLVALSFNAQAATPQQEKAFVDSYKKAFESNDTKALAAFLYTEGAAKETIEARWCMTEVLVKFCVFRTAEAAGGRVSGR